MSIPFDCDATLPLAKRYASQKFRRYARAFSVENAPADALAELRAFIDTTSYRAAIRIFHWHAQFRPEIPESALSKEMLAENLRNLRVEDGIAVFQAMRDGGWTVGHLPPLVRRAIQEMAHRNVPDLHKRLGISKGRLRGILNDDAQARANPVAIGPIMV